MTKQIDLDTFLLVKLTFNSAAQASPAVTPGTISKGISYLFKATILLLASKNAWVSPFESYNFIIILVVIN